MIVLADLHEKSLRSIGTGSQARWTRTRRRRELPASQNPKLPIAMNAMGSPTQRAFLSFRPPMMRAISGRLTYGSLPMHWVTVNNLALAKRILNAGEQLDVVVCNCDPQNKRKRRVSANVRSIPALGRKRWCWSLTTSRVHWSKSESVRVLALMGWLTRPISSKDLWQHIVKADGLSPEDREKVRQARAIIFDCDGTLVDSMCLSTIGLARDD